MTPEGSVGPDPPATHGSTLDRARRVLRGRGFQKLLATRLISQLGDGMFQVAAADYLIFKNPSDNPAWDVAKLSAAILIPFTLLVPFLGVFIDRWDRRRILTLVPIARAVTAALLPLAVAKDPRGVWVYVIVILVLSANRLLLATISAVTPQVVPHDELIIANSVSTTGGSIMTLFGWGLGAVAAELIATNAATALSVAAFVATSVLGAAVPVHRARERVMEHLSAAVAAVVREMRDGIRTIRSEPLVTYALVSIVVMQALMGAVVAASVVTFIVRFDAGVASYSSLLAVTAVGVFLGVATVPRAERQVPKERLIAYAFMAAGAAAAAAAPSLQRAGLMGATLVIGVSFAFAKISVDTIVQERITDAYRGRAFASYDVLYNVARIIGLAVAAAAIQVGASDKAVIATSGIASILVGMGLRFWANRARRAEKLQPRVLLPAGEIVAVRAYAGSRADEEPRAIVVAGHEMPVDRVEWRAVEERNGERRRIFVVRVGDVRVRLAFSELSSAWVVDRVL